ncbi:ABC transporter permease [Mucilaginibacter endophyticus]|uniref:ABC transporter permease n=1 Tax=Mucilaginibacter endophyticus TaxID=2675003 RepID=UPI000E0CDBAA|nr:ABC transporter permease [Mucilaginibacter endophyticus]
MIFVRMLAAAFTRAFQNLKQSGMKSLLSILGVSIGIFMLIMIFSIVDHMKGSLQRSVDKFGTSVTYIEKYPWEFTDDVPWWRYLNRPVVKMSEFNFLERRLQTPCYISFNNTITNQTIKYGDNYINNGTISSNSADFDKISEVKLRWGRKFNENDQRNGLKVALIGWNIYRSLGLDSNFFDRQAITLLGRKVQVIGIIEKEGKDVFNNSADDKIYIPNGFAAKVLNLNLELYQPAIMIKPKSGTEDPDLKFEIQSLMRSVRRLPAQAEDNFSINNTTILVNAFGKLYHAMEITGWIVGSFSLLVGGFGIANIMFVSVKSRTSIIGVQRAIGAKSYYILLEYLFEAIMLCLLGSVVGVLISGLITALVNEVSAAGLSLGPDRLFTASVLAVVIGIISGIAPAVSASRMNPVDAMRSN